jgi:hypothetical protein
MPRWGALGTGLGLRWWLEEQDAALARLVATLGRFGRQGSRGYPGARAGPLCDHRLPPGIGGLAGAHPGPPGC